MKFNELTLRAKKSQNRVGRGIAAGRGKTAGRGTKGQNSRTGGKRKAGFEGGQNPLMQKLPKLRGFRSLNPATETVTTGEIQRLGLKKIDNTTLFEKHVVSSPYAKAKLVVRGDLTNKVDVSLQGISENALAVVQKSGGSFKKIDQLKRVSSQPKTKE